MITRKQIYIASAVIIAILLFVFRKPIGRFLGIGNNSPLGGADLGTLKVIDSGGMPAGKLDASGCLVQIEPLVLVAFGTESEILETKTLGVETCGNPTAIKIVRTKDGWFSLANSASVQVI